MADASHWSAYAELDADADAAEHIRWLGAVARLAPVRRHKERAWELLGLQDGDDALDVGCGDGTDALGLLDHVLPSGSVTGVDLSAKAVERARERAAGRGNIRFEVADIARLPFEDGAFTAAMCDRTLQHLPDPQPALEELRRVLKPGGRLVIGESTSKLTVDGPAPAAHAATRAVHDPDRDASPVVVPMLPLLLARAGFEGAQVHHEEGELTSAEDIITMFHWDRPGFEDAAAEVREHASNDAIRVEKHSWLVRARARAT